MRSSIFQSDSNPNQTTFLKFDPAKKMQKFLTVKTSYLLRIKANKPPKNFIRNNFN